MRFSLYQNMYMYRYIHQLWGEGEGGICQLDIMQEMTNAVFPPDADKSPETGSLAEHVGTQQHNSSSSRYSFFSWGEED